MARARALQLAVGLLAVGTGLTYWLDWRLVALGLGLLFAIDALIPRRVPAPARDDSKGEAS